MNHKAGLGVIQKLSSSSLLTLAAEMDYEGTCERSIFHVASLGEGAIIEIAQAWSFFCTFASKAPSGHQPDITHLINSIAILCRYGLRSHVVDYFLNNLEARFQEHCLSTFWQCFDCFSGFKGTSNQSKEVNGWIQATLPQALRDICYVKALQEECITLVVRCLQTCDSEHDQSRRQQITGRVLTSEDLIHRHRISVTALLLTSAPEKFSEILNCYFEARLGDFSRAAMKQIEHYRMSSDSDQDCHSCDEGGSGSKTNDVENLPSGCSGEQDHFINAPETGRKDADGDCAMEDVAFFSASLQKRSSLSRKFEGIAKVVGATWIEEVTEVVRNLQQLGFSAMTEEACASAVYSLLKEKIHSIATKRYEKPVLPRIRKWIKEIPLKFLQVVLDSDSPSAQDSASYDFPSPLASLRIENTFSNKVARERFTRWHLRLEFFAYETLGNLRINELFDIIVDYPESLPAIEDLRHCLANTGHHTKLVESFRTALRHRLLTAGAATTDILLQYISTIKALRTMDHTGVFLEAVGEPIREYLRRRKDTIRCIVTMLTDDTGSGGASVLGGAGESLLEELSRGTSAIDNVDSEDEGIGDDEDAWNAAERWEPDPVEADPSRTSKSRRSMDIIGMLVGIYGSKELFVNEYRIMLAEKLLSKSDYEIDREIRTLELLKLRFGESSMHSCEIMLKDMADSKRINSNIKATTTTTSQRASKVMSQTSSGTSGEVNAVNRTFTSRATDSGSRLAAFFVARARGVFSQADQTSGGFSTTTDGQSRKESFSQAIETSGRSSSAIEETADKELSLEAVNATIISALFWPPFQVESIKVPSVVEKLLEDYAQKYHELKTPRKLQWKKHLGIVKLELQFEDRAAQFMVSPMHASIIMLFESQSSWAATDLASALGVTVSTLRRRIMLWVNQGVLLESAGNRPGELYYTIIENVSDVGNRNVANALRTSDSTVQLLGEDDGESGVASMEDQLQQEMNVYESYVLGMLTNFDTLPLDRIHNMLKMFVSDPPYDKSLQQLQAFLSGLVSEEKLEVRDGLYRRRQQ
ncbi:hypothetical protein KP509_05G076000 [Ceratopteris richardii]|uniref:Anaphase-promoting complex subunit 2 n=1 Tax=Ceratopteris richardii TaxID=49495 RepID=A0A8T2URY8_CERRI|nr:hypothetical protein KP509_05G076000 [Ceratopteris richardii]